MNANEALLNVIELPKVLSGVNRPYIDWGCFVLQSGCYRSLILTLNTIARLIRNNEIKNPQHPNVELFVDLFRDSHLPWHMEASDWMFEKSERLITRINRFLRDYVRQTKTKEFIKQLSNMRRREKRNALSLLCYCNSLFHVYSRLLVVRVDFHYQPEFYDELSPERVIDDREAFLRSIKREFKWLVGLGWKLEYESQRKFHYHFVFFFDGNKARQDILLGQFLGECWVRITGDIGSYHNCNYEDKNYPEKYLGMIHYSDEQKRRALRHVVYLTKNDENILAISCHGRVRIFGRMETPVRTVERRPRIHASARS